MRQLKNKSIKTYYLTGDSEDQKKLEVIRYEALKIKYTNDSNSVIKIHFEEGTTYGVFVKLVDIMNQDKHQRYAYFNDDFYIFEKIPDKIQKVNSAKPIIILNL